MSNLPPNPLVNANTGQMFNHNQQFGQVPSSQLPPGYGGLKDTNSNSPVHGSIGHGGSRQQMNSYNQSASSSPAFNQPGIMPPTYGGPQSSPMRPQGSLPMGSKPLPSQPPSSTSQTFNNPSPTPNPLNYQKQINDNTPPINPSQFNQSLLNGPHSAAPPVSMPPQYAVSSAYSSPPPSNRPPTTAGFGAVNPSFAPPTSRPPGNVPITNAPNAHFSSPARNSPTIPSLPAGGPSTFSGPPTGPPLGPPRPMGINGPSLPHMNPSIPGQSTGPKAVGGLAGPMSSPSMLPTVSGPPPVQTYPGPHNGPSQTFSPPPGPYAFSGQNVPPSQIPPMGQRLPSAGPSVPPMRPNVPVMGQNMPPMSQGVAPMSHSMPPMGQGVQPVAQQSVPLGGPSGSNGPPKNNMQNRYPQMAPSNYNHQPSPVLSQPGMQYPQQYNAQGLTQQMGQLSVTKQGFDQLWGHHMVDLLQCKNILPEYPEDPPEIKLGPHFADSSNCSPEIFRCTINRIPETNSLLQKSRLPLGILIHPFKDLNHLPVIQCSTIVRCRACRTYINPFVHFVDAKRWKCNLCFRVNDLPEEFQYDPVSRSYGDPSRRPEIKSATIEFIAPGEYMLRPPQPAVYLFLFDVSQIARESGYLQVACDTLKNNLDQLPGDARTQVAFICYDAHVHYYLMGEGLTRPKEMTVLDIDDVFLPSPESLLVNLGERHELVRELLSVLPQRYAAPTSSTAPSAPTSPACALGAALQAAYKLMAPTGGRISVFQTCLPNIGPGALQPREDPNARSSKEVAHLNPATDFYKRIALDCSGAQVAVDLFLLNSQYSDLATLSGMSKFSAGSVQHMPLFQAARAPHREQLARALARYLTRKIGFEAVMRVRCTRGVAIHTFHGNFFVRSTDLLSLPNVSPDAGFGMQLTIEESLSDMQQVCFQAALLYTSSKGERRIRVHTLALPIASNLTEVLHAADQQAIIGLVSKMAVDRSVSASMSEAREAVINVAVDALSAHRLAQNLPAGAASSALHAPTTLRLLPLYLLALLKRKAFRTGTSTRLDDRVADMCALKCLPLPQLMRLVYPDLYPVHELHQYAPHPADPAHPADDEDDEYPAPDPPRLHLSAERINSTGAYLLDDGESMLLLVGSAVSAAFLSETFGVAAHSQLAETARALPRLPAAGSALLHAFIDKLNDDRPYPADLLILKDTASSRTLFTDRLVDDRIESAFSYYDFLQHVKTQVK